jgi:hypothetical protein
MKTANNASAPNNDYGWGIVDIAAAAAFRPTAAGDPAEAKVHKAAPRIR